MNFGIEKTTHLISYSKEIDSLDLLSWVQNRNDGEKFYLKLRDNQWEWAGTGNIFSERISTVESAYDFVRNESSSHIKIFVAHTFDLSSKNSYFTLPRFEILKSNEKTVLKINCWADEDPQKFLSQDFLFNADKNINLEKNSRVSRVDKPDIKDWDGYFNRAKEYLKDHPKIVLARVTESIFSKPVDPISLLISLNQESYRCYVKLPSGEEIVSVSPERFFRISDGTLRTEAVAGTKPLNADPSELLESPKERAEHKFVVDEILKQIVPFTEHVEFLNTPQVAAFKKVLHLKTPIVAKLKKGISYLNIIEALHPTPAVGGLPKKEALSWLGENEPFNREFYASPVGVVAKDFVELFVNIRSVLISERKMKLYSGVGVVSESQCHSEWDELELKASQFWEALP